MGCVGQHCPRGDKCTATGSTGTVLTRQLSSYLCGTVGRCLAGMRLGASRKKVVALASPWGADLPPAPFIREPDGAKSARVGRYLSQACLEACSPEEGPRVSEAVWPLLAAPGPGLTPSEPPDPYHSDTLLPRTPPSSTFCLLTKVLVCISHFHGSDLLPHSDHLCLSLSALLRDRMQMDMPAWAA